MRAVNVTMFKQHYPLIMRANYCPSAKSIQSNTSWYEENTAIAAGMECTYLFPSSRLLYDMSVKCFVNLDFTIWWRSAAVPFV